MDFSSARGAAAGTSATESHARAGTKLTACTIDAKKDGLENVSFYHFAAESGVHCPGLAVEQQEVSRMCTVVIYSADGEFINEIPVRNVLEGQQYADQLAAEMPCRIYNVMDESRNKVYSR